MKKSSYVGGLVLTIFFTSIIIFISSYMLFTKVEYNFPFKPYYPNTKTITWGIINILVYVTIVIKCCYPIYKSYSNNIKGIEDKIDYYEYLKYLIFLGLYPIIPLMFSLAVSLGGN